MQAHPLPPIRRPRHARPGLAAAVALSAVATPLAGQADTAQAAPDTTLAADGARQVFTGPAAWNTPRVLGMVERARSLRASQAVDSAFRDYRAEARGYVYFFIDRPDSDERTLVKADQIALQLFWRAPDLTHQRIVGLRDEQLLPTNIRYHLDHLTVVQDDFGDWIEMGEGDEVERVLHPMGPQSEVTYDFRLADSLSIRHGGRGEEVRVYEVRVRPKTPDLPGFIGSVFLDRDQAAIVRMNFTFTPASYVDPYVDYIRVSLDNSLWDGRFWLPYRQEAEIRREMPALDFLSGSIIRGRFQIGPYDFNVGLPAALFSGPAVTSVSEERREAFPFERGLYADLQEQGLGPVESLESVRAQARELVTDRALSGLNRYRVFLRSFSDAFRYNRAEGFFAGAGVNVTGPRDSEVHVSAGWAFGRGSGSFALGVTGPPGPVVPEVELYWNRLRDLGPATGTNSVVNTIGSAFTGDDYLDPWFTRGVRLGARGPRVGRDPAVSFTLEDHVAAEVVVDEEDARPVRGIEEGRLLSLGLRVGVPVPRAETGWVEGAVSRFEGRTFPSLGAGAGWRIEGDDRAWWVDVDAGGGWVGTEAPPQSLFALGGRWTVPGHPYRELTGNAYGLARAALTVPLVEPWIGARVVGAAGATHLERETFPPGWEDYDQDGARAALGVGASLLWDVLLVDLVRGLGEGGSWDVVVAITPRLLSWL